MEVLESSEDYGGAGEPVAFHHSNIIYRMNNEVYQASSRKRCTPNAEFKLSDLYNITMIFSAALSAPFDPSFTETSNPSQWYIKRPKLSTYTNSYPEAISQLLTREARVCETIKRNPHPNIAQYHGCEVQDSRIKGLCFTKYDCTLYQQVNPRKYGKRAFVAHRGELSPLQVSSWLRGIEAGIRHLHSLGIIHNDINPSNIMFAGDIPIITDFDSAAKEGDDMTMHGGTYEWYDETRRIARPQNDLDALRELDTWLRGSVDDFIYET
ncbi:hypothetical protein N7541_000275 [Penicillium brevicompactum]|uniref:Protein kinase domain-containing protein n=1 Tax=Penicillium brevicompactum TaxID=5074 RepID=A0A9W9RWH3_PENBR|nr:hypothetical protein N7541_000275 [Penicillium brevicompactum]